MLQFVKGYKDTILGSAEEIVEMTCEAFKKRKPVNVRISVGKGDDFVEIRTTSWTVLRNTVRTLNSTDAMDMDVAMERAESLFIAEITTQALTTAVEGR